MKLKLIHHNIIRRINQVTFAYHRHLQNIVLSWNNLILSFLSRSLKYVKTLREKNDGSTTMSSFYHTTTTTKTTVKVKSKKRRKKKQHNKLSNNRKMPKNSRLKSPKKTRSLLSLAYSQEWHKLATLAEYYPEELMTPNEDTGALPLHIACACGDMIEIYVIRALLNAAPSSARHLDNEGSTPLHFLLHYSNSCPNINILSLLIEAWPQAITTRDSCGRTPLFHAVDSGLSIHRLKLLVDTGLAADSITQPCGPTIQHESPLYHRGTSSSKFRAMTICSRPESGRTPLYLAWHSVLREKKRMNEKGKLWNKALLLLHAAYQDKMKQQNPSIKNSSSLHLLHASIGLQSYLPPQMYDHVLENELEKCVKIVQTSTGMLPIHIAASHEDNEKNLKTVTTLLDAYPESAMCQSLEGRLPFHYAILAGWNWDSLQILIRAFKPSSQITDPVTGLSPFMLASSNLLMPKTKNDEAPTSFPMDVFTPRFQNSSKPMDLISGYYKDDKNEDDKCNQKRRMISRNSKLADDKNSNEKPETSIHRTTKKLDTIYQLMISNPNFGSLM